MSEKSYTSGASARHFEKRIEENRYHLSRDRNTTLIGSSYMCFEPPNTCLVVYVGDLDADTVGQMNALLARIACGAGRLLLLIDLSQVDSVSDTARRLGVTGMRTLNPRATAVFGANAYLRIIAALIVKTASMFDAYQKSPACFFAREKEARGWLARIQNGSTSPGD